MPILKDFRRTKVLKLKKYEGSEIEIYDSLLAGDITDFKAGDEGNTAKSLSLVAKLIKSWNFTNEKNEPLEVNLENIKLLDIESITEISNTVKDFSIEVKKKD